MKLEEQFLISDYVQVTLEEFNNYILEDLKADNPDLKEEDFKIKETPKKVIHIWEK